MTNGTQTTPDREFDPQEWGKNILEEILFRAARDIAAKPAGDAGVTVPLTFHLTADEASGTIEITTPGAVEPFIKLRLPLDRI